MTDRAASAPINEIPPRYLREVLAELSRIVRPGGRLVKNGFRIELDESACPFRHVVAVREPAAAAPL